MNLLCRANAERGVLAAVLALLAIVFWVGFAGVIWQWRHAVESTKAEQRTAYARAIGQSYADWRDVNTSSAERVLSLVEAVPEISDSPSVAARVR